jgi:hypothetical protein
MFNTIINIDFYYYKGIKLSRTVLNPGYLGIEKFHIDVPFNIRLQKTTNKTFRRMNEKQENLLNF